MRKYFSFISKKILRHKNSIKIKAKTNFWDGYLYVSILIVTTIASLVEAITDSSCNKTICAKSPNLVSYLSCYYHLDLCFKITLITWKFLWGKIAVQFMTTAVCSSRANQSLKRSCVAVSYDRNNFQTLLMSEKSNLCSKTLEMYASHKEC